MKKVQFVLITASILAGMLLSTGCLKNHQYNVRGDWVITGEYGGTSFVNTLTFTGNTKTHGSVTDELSITANYSFDGYNVEFDLSMICFCNKTWIGYFIDKNHMKGVVKGCRRGTWTASRRQWSFLEY